MIISIRKIVRWIQMVSLICLFSIVLYKMLEVVHVWIEPIDRYRVPSGDSIKVIADLPLQPIAQVWLDDIINRLKQFYFMGE